MSMAPERSSGRGGEIASPAIVAVPPTAAERLSFLMTEDQTDALAMTEDQNGVLAMTEDQTDALAAEIGHAFPVWRIWRANGIWYATGPCPLPGCVCSRTVHAPSPSGLCRQLDSGGRQRLASEGVS
jgi:hypothetical protein